MRRLRTLAISCSLVALATATVFERSHAAAVVPVTREAHMEMTLRGEKRPGDDARGAAILAAARGLMAKYANVADAERDGYAKFLPNVPLPHEHYTSRANAIRAAFGSSFDPTLPTSIIYRRTASGLVVEGVMYTAPNRFDADQLDARVPLSLGTWHRHIDFCWAPSGTFGDARFGFSGSIVTKADCDAAGGRFTPRVFGWMVHVWPNATTPSKVWAVDVDGEMDHANAAATFQQTSLTIPLARLPNADVVAGDVARGAAIFTGNCASCHGAGGANGPDAPRLAGSGLRAGQVAYMVAHPRAIDSASSMPELGLSDRDIADVAAYVASIARPKSVGEQ